VDADVGLWAGRAPLLLPWASGKCDKSLRHWLWTTGIELAGFLVVVLELIEFVRLFLAPVEVTVGASWNFLSPSLNCNNRT